MIKEAIVETSGTLWDSEAIQNLEQRWKVMVGLWQDTVGSKIYIEMTDGQKLRTERWLVKTFNSSGMNEVPGI